MARTAQLKIVLVVSVAACVLMLLFTLHSANPGLLLAGQTNVVDVTKYISPVIPYTFVNGSSHNDTGLVKRYDIILGSQSNRTKPFACVPLITTVVENTPICIYDPKIDIYVSGSIKKYGNWEGGQIRQVMNFLKLYTDMEFLDLGCNVGVYTLGVTKLGRRVVSVDANVKNLRLLSRSLVLGGLQNHSITLLYNAISDKVETVQLKPSNKNIGGTRVVEADPAADEEQKSQGITLDHLVPLFSNRPLFIKMDIETNEWKALKSGSKFFKYINVQYVLMEWMHHKTRPEGGLIIQFFMDHSFRPYHPNQLPKMLRVELMHSWPGDILWIKDGAHILPST